MSNYIMCSHFGSIFTFFKFCSRNLNMDAADYVTLPDLVDVATVVALPKVCILLEVFPSENDDEIEEESANKTINTDSNDDNEHTKNAWKVKGGLAVSAML